MDVFEEIPQQFYLPKHDHRSGQDTIYLHRHPNGENNSPQFGWVLFLSVQEDCVRQFYKDIIPYLNNLTLGENLRGVDHKLVMNQQALNSLKQQGKIVVIFVARSYLDSVIKRLDAFLCGLRASLAIKPGPVPQRRVSAMMSTPEEQLGTSGILFGRPFQL
jgi:hypothetical protein